MCERMWWKITPQKKKQIKERKKEKVGKEMRDDGVLISLKHIILEKNVLCMSI